MKSRKNFHIKIYINIKSFYNINSQLSFSIKIYFNLERADYKTS